VACAPRKDQGGLGDIVVLDASWCQLGDSIWGSTCTEFEHAAGEDVVLGKEATREMTRRQAETSRGEEWIRWHAHVSW
jgi:hypothetical protein